jgi:hypothetical protein
MEALDAVFEQLATERRRGALYDPDRRDGPVSVAELAAVIEDWEDDPGDPDAEAADETYERVVLSLEHHHLPKAAEAKFVEYDREAGEVRITGAPTEVEVVLSVASALERPADDDVLGVV